MPYSAGDLRREIRNLIAADLAAGSTIVRGWVEHAVLSKHPLGPVKDRDFNTLCRSETVSNAVRDVLRDLRARAEDPEAVSSSGVLLLPGFKHLQLGYPLIRHGKEVLVPIACMTSAERLTRAAQYRKMGDGCHEHAEELERYDGDHKDHAA